MLQPLDIGSIRLARGFAEALNVKLAIVDKRRLNATQVEMNALIGDVEGCGVLLVDDMCSTGGTLRAAAFVCKQMGAKRVFAAVTHGLFVGMAFEESAIEKMLITNIVPLEGTDLCKIEIVSIAPLLSRAIDSIIGVKSTTSYTQT